MTAHFTLKILANQRFRTFASMALLSVMYFASHVVITLPQYLTVILRDQVGYHLTDSLRGVELSSGDTFYFLLIVYNYLMLTMRY